MTRRGRGPSFYFSLLYTVRKPLSVTIAMVVLTILGFVIITAALVYVFWVQKQSAIYHVNQGSSWLPLTSKQPHEALGEEPS